MRFRDWSIRRKLTLMLMGISSLAVLAACLAFYFLVTGQYHESYRHDLESLAGILAANCQAALSFQISEDAVDLLASLQNRPSIIAADIYDAAGNHFTGYANKTVAITKPGASIVASEEGNPFSGVLLISHDIELNGRKIGWITLQDDMRSIKAFRTYAMGTLVAIILLVLGLTRIFAVRLREIISGPIGELAGVAQEISERQDYSLQAEKGGNDEVGKLVDAFNNMLLQISQRNTDLQNSEARFRTFINQAVDAFFLHDLDGRFIDANQRACSSLGYSREELLSMTVAAVDANADNQAYREQYWSRMSPGVPLTLEGMHRRKDGTIYPVEVRCGLLELGGEMLVMAMARDISERRAAENKRLQLESQLLQAQKMESIGTLAGGIAHDFNNMLTPIYGYLDIAMTKVHNDPELLDDLTQVHDAADRAKDLVQQILTFSRRESEKQVPVDVHIIVKEALKLLRASIPATIEIRQNIAADSGSVLANPTQIHQIVMNLCVNAYHAMRETGGILGVSLVPLDITVNDFLQNITLKPGSYLRLEVSDTGSGMAPEIIDRIFEPYFTTKLKGEGTGLGLSVVHGIVTGHGGDITVYSEPTKGTTFHVYLPVIKKISTAAIHDDTPAPGGNERILLVDDEEMVRMAEKALLASLGYDVMAFSDPFMALEFFNKNPDQFDLVVTDMTMPGMTGDKLALRIMKTRPGIPVILCTGFSDLINEESAMAIGFSDYVTKPLSRHPFAMAIRRVLDKETVAS